MKDFLGLERNVVLAASADFLLGFGEELWNKFLPKYLEALGAGVLAIGLFGAVKNFFDAVYQYPGGWLADRLGRRHALQIFLGLASLGYLVYFVSPSWPFVFLGLALAMSWTSMASPAIFAVIGDALPKNRRAMGFTIQSLVKRIPRALAPLVGGGEPQLCELYRLRWRLDDLSSSVRVLLSPHDPDGDPERALRVLRISIEREPFTRD